MRKNLFAFIVLALLGSCNSGKPAENTEAAVASSQAPWSVRMADSDMKRNPRAWMIDFRKAPKWEYTNGLMCTAHEKVWKRTGDRKYFDYIETFANTMVQADGSILTYKKEDYNIDRVNSGKFLIGVHQETKEEKSLLAIENLRDQMRKHPRTKEGGFWHKKVYPHQMWLDGLYMGTPFLARYAATYTEPALYDDIANQFRLIDQYTWDEQRGMFLHGWDESREQKWADPQTGRSPHVWGRSVGWLAMALVDVLEYFPEDHPQRADILRVTQKMAEGIVRYQDPESGVWWQVMDMGGREGNYLESSASTMFVYFLAKAAKQGYIDQKYLDAAQRGYKGILEEFIREEADGTISITNVCSVAGLGGNPYRDASYEYYISEPKRENDPKGVGPFILASLELEELEKPSAGN